MNLTKIEMRIPKPFAKRENVDICQNLLKDQETQSNFEKNCNFNADNKTVPFYAQIFVVTYMDNL